MQTARNVAIVVVLALAVATVPGGGNAAEALLTAISIGFLLAIGFLGYRMYMEHRLTIWSMTDVRRALFYGAFGLIVLLIAGADEIMGGEGGILIWLALLGAAGFGIFKLWSDATRYS